MNIDNYIEVKQDIMSVIIGMMEAKKLVNDPKAIEKAFDSFILMLNKTTEKIDKAIQETLQLTLELRKYEQESAEYKKKLAEVEAALDNVRASMGEDDITGTTERCERRYGQFWNFISEKSRDYLITAKYIYNKIKALNKDFAPAVVEMCRAVENEIKSKIFEGFVSEMAYSDSIKLDDSKLSETIRNFKRSSLFIDITLQEMIYSFRDMERIGRRAETSHGQLRNYLDNHQWDADKLSSDSFVKEFTDYVKEFRNGSAHTTSFSQKEAEKCEEKTDKRIKAFLRCHNRSY